MADAVMRCRSHVPGWLQVEPRHRRVVRSWAWGCQRCRRVFGRGSGTIRLATRYMVEEDIGLWEMDA